MCDVLAAPYRDASGLIALPRIIERDLNAIPEPPWIGRFTALLNLTKDLARSSAMNAIDVHRTSLF
jgi:hypothetical protein